MTSGRGDVEPAHLPAGRPHRPGRAADGLISAGLLAGAMLIAQTGSPWPAGNDSGYHLKMAWLLPEIGWQRTFPWLHWSIFREGFVNHHAGFHLLLAPVARGVTAAGWPLAVAGKAWPVLVSAALGAALAALLRGIGLRPAWPWVALLLLAPWHFWLRHAYVRAPPVLVLAALGAIALLRRPRPWALGVLAWAAGFVYTGAIVLLALPVGFAVAAASLNRPLRPYLLPIATMIAGLVLSQTVNPWFPANLAFLKVQLLDVAWRAPGEVGNEWRPYGAWFLLTVSAPLGLVWLACLVRRLGSGVPADVTTLGLLLVNAAMFVLMCKARRFVEYWPVFALLSAAALAAPTMGVRGVVSRLQSRRRWWRAPGVLAGLFVAGVTLHLARRQAEPSHDLAAIREAMTWLAANSPRGSLVFTDDWDVFPACFLFNHHNHYVVGLDPMFTRVPYPRLWEKYRLITRGRVPSTLPPENVAVARPAMPAENGGTAPSTGQPTGQPVPVCLTDIVSDFHARYVFVARDHSRLYERLIEADDAFSPVWPIGLARDDAQPPVALFEARAPVPPGSDPPL